MKSLKAKLLRASIALAAPTFPVTWLNAGPASAQPVQQEDAGDVLTHHLRALSADPRNFQALMGAGHAALELGDEQGALTFFARAEEIAPRDGRVKAALGSAFLALEQVPEAMRFFTEAESLGAPVSDFANDRGLAFDLLGDPRRAQNDYRLALGRKDDPETRRRLALSLAISGERDNALKVIDEQLRRQDRAAWRVRAFILALAGDPAGATKAVEAVLPGHAAEMQPFFVKLPALSLVEQAMAVHLGRFPGESGPQRSASVASQSTAIPSSMSVAPTETGKPDAGQLALGTPASSNPLPTPQIVSQPPVSSPAQPITTPSAQPSLMPPAQPSVSLPAQPAPSTATQSRLSSVAALVAALANQAPAEPAPELRVAAPEPKKSQPALDPAKKKAESAKAKEPSRIWVQIAGGANKAALPREFDRLKAKAPKLLSGKTAWTTQLRFTNRLLVGPFKTQKEAQEFVNELNKLDFGAFAWTSPEGQEIEKLGAK